jgi:hypothetical protein
VVVVAELAVRRGHIIPWNKIISTTTTTIPTTTTTTIPTIPTIPTIRTINPVPFIHPDCILLLVILHGSIQ